MNFFEFQLKFDLLVFKFELPFELSSKGILCSVHNPAPHVEPECRCPSLPPRCDDLTQSLRL